MHAPDWSKLDLDLKKFVRELPIPVKSAKIAIPISGKEIGFVLTLFSKELDQYLNSTLGFDFPTFASVYDGHKLPVYVETYLTENLQHMILQVS